MEWNLATLKKIGVLSMEFIFLILSWVQINEIRLKTAIQNVSSCLPMSDGLN